MDRFRKMSVISFTGLDSDPQPISSPIYSFPNMGQGYPSDMSTATFEVVYLGNLIDAYSVHIQRRGSSFGTDEDSYQ